MDKFVVPVINYLTMDPVSASIPLTDISRKKKRPTDLEAQVVV